MARGSVVASLGLAVALVSGAAYAAHGMVAASDVPTPAGLLTHR